jgi:signal transduction histidine kinase
VASADDDVTERPAILIVDDHAPNLLALEAVLAPLGYHLVKATSGAEALRKATSEDFVLIVMDVHMPGLDGYKTVEILRGHERVKDVPIVFLTAVYKVDEHVRRGYALGAADFITKPFDPVVLRAKVSALVSLYLRGRRAERAHRDENDRLKDLFLGAVGHDLRTPLSSILLAARLLDDAVPSEVRARQAKRIERAALRMNQIIEDVLDLTRDRFAGGLALKIEEADLAAICRDVIADVRTAHRDRPIDFEVACDARGEWDATRLARVVYNLVGNAVQHTTEGGVRVVLTGDDDEVSISVQNRGPAIPSEVLPELFEPFRRGASSFEGVGLGLYIVREIVRAHGGSVDASSTSAKGTRFVVTLPRKAANRDARVLPGPKSGSIPTARRVLSRPR